ncbi:hypothetical protein C2E23DRAFT_835058 [Lenzites betulinus]|nr:hypothetical protein C2E23DRAFT_835058 [Lenzites betulinus]
MLLNSPRIFSAIPRRAIQVRAQSLLSRSGSGAREFKVILDNDTLYVDQRLAEALGWTTATQAEGVSLTLNGWAPHYFAITRTGTDSDLLARGTVESSLNPRVQQILEYLKYR